MNGTSKLESYSAANALVGSLYLVTPLAILTIYVPCIVVLFTDDDFKHLSCLRIMGHMGLTDILHILGFMACGVWELTGVAKDIPYWLNRTTITLTIIPGWWNYIFLVNILGFNRCLARVRPQLEYRIFSKKATNVWLCAVWLNTAVWIGFFCTPLSGWIYHPEIFSFYYDFNLPWTKYAIWAAFFHCVFHTALTTLWYGIIVVATYFEVHGLGAATEESRAKERSLLKQSVIICLVLAVADQYFHNGVKLALPWLGKYAYVLGNFLLICTSGCNPFIYLTFNETLRTKTKAKFFGKANVAPIEVKESKAVKVGDDILQLQDVE